MKRTTRRPEIRLKEAAIKASLVGLTFGGLWACGGPTAPAHPTWADVQPIVAGQCVHCHGSTSNLHGGGFRLDFYDMSEDLCGDAAQVIGANAPLAKAHAPRIINALSGDAGNGRPLMPPPPAPYVEGWQWTTLLRWWQDGAPKGDLPPDNHPATLSLYHSAATVDRTWQLTALVDDADGDPVVGVLRVGDVSLPMDRAGSFGATLDTSGWADGNYVVTATLCDGWSKVDATVATLEVRHAL